MKNGCSEVHKPSYPPFLWPPQWKSPNPFAEAGSSARCRRPVVGRCPLRPLTITLPSCASPPHSGTASFAFFPISDPPPFGYCAGIVPIKNFLPNLTRFLLTVPRKKTQICIRSLRRVFLLQPQEGQCQNFDIQKNVIKGILTKYRSGNQGRNHGSESAWIGVGP